MYRVTPFRSSAGILVPVTVKMCAYSSSLKAFDMSVILPTGTSKLKVCSTSDYASSEVLKNTISSEVDASVAVLSAILQVICVVDVVYT